MKKIILILITMMLTVPTFAQAGELQEWLRAATFVYLRHEIGHQDRVEARGTSLEWSYKGNVSPIPDYRLEYKAIPEIKQGTIYAAKVANSEVVSSAEGEAAIAKYNAARKIQQDIYEDNARLCASVGGGGFIAQQVAVEELPSGEFKRKSMILSALLKAGYVPYYYALPTASGDIQRMAVASPAELISSALLISAVTDYWRASQATIPTWRIDVISDVRTGAVGLAYAGRF